jgi:hypothetical protein
VHIANRESTTRTGKPNSSSHLGGGGAVGIAEGGGLTQARTQRWQLTVLQGRERARPLWGTVGGAQQGVELAAAEAPRTGAGEEVRTVVIVRLQELAGRQGAIGYYSDPGHRR